MLQNHYLNLISGLKKRFNSQIPSVESANVNQIDTENVKITNNLDNKDVKYNDIKQELQNRIQLFDGEIFLLMLHF
jgi:hypothetical protein